ncbi:hypothetical protein PENCOP_c002G06050 [Penicillium coprophilum]|uniref:Arrestin-like N-terminal domain-containing protein n=1 Tax=Penicillium coprophilum TaxID=36646 RepID=A0A1V6V1J6_9EURO|nr:hypothetical protein PENCOP_c002G06050 [Penicillium coprophilum]
MSPTNEVRVTITNPENLMPGEDITARATLTLIKPLSVSELTVTIFGRAYTSISRTYVVRNFSYEWLGQGFFFKRFVVLIRSPTTLPAGEHSFSFTVQLPTSTEQVQGNWHFFNKWKDRAPFPGKNSVHPLPGTMAMGCNQTWGTASAHVEYIVSTAMKKGPEAGFFSSIPKGSSVFVVSPRPRPDLPQVPVAGSWQQLTRTIQTPNGTANITCRLPQVLTQRSQIPVYFKADRPLELTGLKIKIHVVYLVRGRHVIFPEKRTKCTHTVWLVKAETGSMELGSEFLLAKSTEFPEAVPMTFVTFNLACLAHWMEIKYRVRAPGGNTEVKDVMKDISVQVQSWTGGQAQGNGVQIRQAGEGLIGEVLNEEEYRRWSAEKKV